MDYEKAYKEALERAIFVKENTDSIGARDVSDVIEYIFSELKEAEDEKIRKALVHLINEQDGFLTEINGISVKDILAWLEKQGEKKVSWSEDDEKMLSDACIMLDWYKGNNWWTAQHIKDWLKSLKERIKPQWKPSEEQIQALEYQVHSTYKCSWQYAASKELLEQLKKL